ncbi:MAG: hypothetical protein ACKVKC_04380 [Rhodobacterales bacterium]
MTHNLIPYVYTLSGATDACRSALLGVLLPDKSPHLWTFATLRSGLQIS